MSETKISPTALCTVECRVAGVRVNPALGRSEFFNWVTEMWEEHGGVSCAEVRTFARKPTPPRASCGCGIRAVDYRDTWCEPVEEGGYPLGKN